MLVRAAELPTAWAKGKGEGGPASMGNFCRDLEQQVVLNLARCAVCFFVRHCELVGRTEERILVSGKQAVSREKKRGVRRKRENKFPMTGPMVRGLRSGEGGRMRGWWAAKR